jgi:hypothetical protein
MWRVGGRLQNILLSYDEKHPIMLSRKSRLTTLIINHAHRQTMHGGDSQTLAFLRRKYWIIDGKNSVRTHIHQCIICFRFRTKASEQIMGLFPPERVRPSSPFTHLATKSIHSRIYSGPESIHRTQRIASNNME